MAECLCISYASEYGVPVKIVRLCQTFGPGVVYSDNRVFAQFAKSSIEEPDSHFYRHQSSERQYEFVWSTNDNSWRARMEAYVLSQS